MSDEVGGFKVWGACNKAYEDGYRAGLADRSKAYEDGYRTAQNHAASAAIPGPGVKHDSDKPDWTLLPWPALEEVVRVLEHGAKRYGRDNWRKVPEPERRYLAAAIRHITAVLGGELVDPDSQRAHLAHAVCSLLFIIAKEDK